MLLNEDFQQKFTMMKENGTHLERMEMCEQVTKHLHELTVAQHIMEMHQEYITPLLKEDKYKKNLVCLIGSEFTNIKPWAPRPQVYYEENIDMNIIVGYNKLRDFLYYLNSDLKFSGMTDNPNESRLIQFFPRYATEYNHLFVQVCVVVIIQDTEGNYLLLQNNADSQGRVKDNISFIQGHVEVNNEINFKTAKEYLQEEAIREVNEEVSGIEIHKTEDMELSALFYDNRTQIGMEHLSVIMKLKVDSLKDVQTNESDKHTVLIVSEEELANLEGVDNLIEYIYQTKEGK